ncbi:hypothetical protein MRX96_051125 [Rhipicephalus microplus]
MAMLWCEAQRQTSVADSPKNRVSERPSCVGVTSGSTTMNPLHVLVSIYHRHRELWVACQLVPFRAQHTFLALKTAVCSQKHGAFQTTVFYFVLLVAFVLPFHTLPLRIVNHDVDYWCARPSHLHNVSPEMWKEVMIPQI